MLKKPRKINRDAWVRGQLRRISLKWPERTEAIKLARVSHGNYRCAICKRENVRNKEKEVDHILPVVEINSQQRDWNVFIERLLPYRDQWQILCKLCHEIKTGTENSMREFYSKKRKK